MAAHRMLHPFHRHRPKNYPPRLVTPRPATINLNAKHAKLSYGRDQLLYLQSRNHESELSMLPSLFCGGFFEVKLRRKIGVAAFSACLQTIDVAIEIPSL
jgi:hypothetical protein